MRFVWRWTTRVWRGHRSLMSAKRVATPWCLCRGLLGGFNKTHGKRRAVCRGYQCHRARSQAVAASHAWCPFDKLRAALRLVLRAVSKGRTVSEVEAFSSPVSVRCRAHRGLFRCSTAVSAVNILTGGTPVLRRGTPVLRPSTSNSSAWPFAGFPAHIRFARGNPAHHESSGRSIQPPKTAPWFGVPC